MAKMKVVTTMLNGKRVGHFEGVQNLETDVSVQKAIDKGYVVGKKELVTSVVSGVVRSMVAGVSKDANGRKVDGQISMQPVVTLSIGMPEEENSTVNVQPVVSEKFAPYWIPYREVAPQRRLFNSAALDEFRWMLEEYRVSLSAQELHTPEPISPKRLDAKWTAI